MPIWENNCFFVFNTVNYLTTLPCNGFMGIKSYLVVHECVLWSVGHSFKPCNLCIYLGKGLQGCPFKSHDIYQNVMFNTCCGPNTWEALSVEIKNIKFSTNDFIWFIFLFRLTSLDVESKSCLIKMSKEEQMRLKYKSYNTYPLAKL